MVLNMGAHTFDTPFLYMDIHKAQIALSQIAPTVLEGSKRGVLKAHTRQTHGQVDEGINKHIVNASQQQFSKNPAKIDHYGVGLSSRHGIVASHGTP